MAKTRRARAWQITYLIAVVLRLASVTLFAAAAPDPAQDAAWPNPLETIVLKGHVLHVQGLDVDTDSIYATSVDTGAARALLHKFDRHGGLVAMVDLTDGARYHAGGIALDESSDLGGQVGGGVDIPLNGFTMFVETRYVIVPRSPKSWSYIPITVGLHF